MTDHLKTYIDENRAAFDHREPPADALAKVRTRLKIEIEKKQKTRRIRRFKWIAAASVLPAIITAYLLQQHFAPAVHRADIVQQDVKKVIQKAEADTIRRTKANKPVRSANIASASHVIPVKRTFSKHSLSEIPPNDVYARLRDSSSASVRLAAVLELDRSDRTDRQTLDLLAKTLNKDPNTNVRLAALNILSRYATDTHVVAILTSSLPTQDDPVIQLGLVRLVGKLNVPKMENTLFALVDDPATLGAVKDEAYTILMNQNKL